MTVFAKGEIRSSFPSAWMACGWRTGLAGEDACGRGASGFSGWLQASVGGPRLERASQVGCRTWLVWIPACTLPKGRDCLQRLLDPGPVSGSDSDEKQMLASRWKSSAPLVRSSEPELASWQGWGGVARLPVLGAAVSVHCCTGLADIACVAEPNRCAEKPRQSSSNATTATSHTRQWKLVAGVRVALGQRAVMGVRQIPALEYKAANLRILIRMIRNYNIKFTNRPPLPAPVRSGVCRT